MKKILFFKMHGLGNDFVVIDNRTQELVIDTKAIQLICDRHLGIGCDQLLILKNAEDDAEVKLLIFNPDGSEAEACGNGLRCVANYIMDQTRKDSIAVETHSGTVSAWRQSDGNIKVGMGIPKYDWKSVPLAKECDPLSAPISAGALTSPVCVNIGNPHAVFFVEDVDVIDLSDLGPKLESHSMFPNKSNIEVVSIEGTNRLRMRVWERGVGITSACGSGACAAMVAASLKGLVGSKVEVRLDGGFLRVIWENLGEIFLIGPVANSFSGTVEHSFLIS